jgi:hypothetical protein
MQRRQWTEQRHLHIDIALRLGSEARGGDEDAEDDDEDEVGLEDGDGFDVGIVFAEAVVL